MEIRELQESDLPAVIQFTILAFEPIFTSFASILGPQIYPIVYPDWEGLQTTIVDTLRKNENTTLWVADVDNHPVGLVAVNLNDEELVGEIEFLVVHPEYQNQEVGTQLNNFALSMMKDAGMKAAKVGTGGDSSHAPARRAYEKVGFVPLPTVWYFKSLE